MVINIYARERDLCKYFVVVDRIQYSYYWCVVLSWELLCFSVKKEHIKTCCFYFCLHLTFDYKGNKLNVLFRIKVHNVCGSSMQWSFFGGGEDLKSHICLNHVCIYKLYSFEGKTWLYFGCNLLSSSFVALFRNIQLLTSY